MSCRECGSPFPDAHYGDCRVACGMMPAPPPFGQIDDGHGTSWNKCKADCRMVVVRPGRADCDCEKGWSAQGEGS